jgi:hypothetical protein
MWIGQCSFESRGFCFQYTSPSNDARAEKTRLESLLRSHTTRHRVCYVKAIAQPGSKLQDCPVWDCATNSVRAFSKFHHSTFRALRRCLLGTSCNQCENANLYWTYRLIWACENMPCWPADTLCLESTSYKECFNGSYWFRCNYSP